MSDPPLPQNARIDREKKTIQAMIGIYCRAKHAERKKGELCPECRTLLEYAWTRLDHCPFGGNKTPCAKCHSHCFKPSNREKIKLVMRYAGPKMLLRHPFLAIRHILDGFRP
jgi:hypothetical protein